MSDIGPVNRPAHLRAPLPWLRHCVGLAALQLRGEDLGRESDRLVEAFERFTQTLTSEGLFEALCPDDARLFAELPTEEQRRYAEAAARLHGESADPTEEAT